MSDFSDDDEAVDRDFQLENIESQELFDDESDLEFDELSDLETPEFELDDIESFAVGDIAEIEIPKTKPGLKLALEVNEEEGVIKVAEVPSEAVVHEEQQSEDQQTN